MYATIANFPSKDSTTLKFCKLSANECKPESIESPDKRVISCYSPGFLLPLILAAMQSEASETLTRSKGSPVWNLATFSSKGGSGTLLSHRLYEKGALALALVSLSCECPNVRKLSIAIIGMYLEVLDSELARKSTSWRERPQIAMILNGVQRALVIRHAEEIGEGNSFELLLVVPALPGFSAVFLARASLILGRSSDTLFIAMNRAFLQTETDCGSFRDLTRLPAFMALFCSSTDEAQRLSSERNFALELVKDGLYDEESYRLLISCHCPELILDSIMNADALTSFDSRDEIPLIFTVLSKMITVGGERAASHLLIRVGLLTFLRSILVDHLLLRNYPSHVEFLELLSVAAAKTADLIPASDFEAATSGVGESALSLLLGTVNKKSSELSARSKILLCQLLSTLTRGVDSVVDVPPLVFMKEFNKNGIKLETAIAFISINHSPSNLRSCVHSICSLPVMCEPEDASLVEEFCVLVLRTEKSTIHGDVRFIETAFRRISFLVSEVDLSFSRKANVIQNVLPWFSTVRSQNQTLAAWQTCLAILVADQVAEQQVSLTDVSHVTDLASWVVNNHRISSHVRL